MLKYISWLILLLGVLVSCQKEDKGWNIDLKAPLPKVKIVDISHQFYDESYSLEDFKKEYPWFQGTVSDEDFMLRRKDTLEINIYKEALKKVNVPELEKGLSELFARVQHYFPQFKTPVVYLYSSAVQDVEVPVFYHAEKNWLFIDIAAFMGEGNRYYRGVNQYLQVSMNPQNLLPKAALALSEHIVPMDRSEQKFIDKMMYEGKLMLLQDALLPNTADYLKIGYTPKQYEWATQNKSNIWNFFVENDLLFSDDMQLSGRFLAPAPFSKFYTEVDNESSPRVGVYTGWEIGRKFFKEKPETPLPQFLNMKGEEIFNQSKYQGK
ncbi:gliding motility lipoprotein GldB [Riemerella anatipestifer]|uniref:gliding motility lipoprotein GldB n=1 Tax=Riemerella anatipestifer TaxID=34085 RepID=UPI0021F8CA6A|nr:gliding motility protein GldB [Riemerella anatipestifer]MCW0488465.1 gliding motility protein GldB [Riemerella anatipestifer]